MHPRLARFSVMILTPENLRGSEGAMKATGILSLTHERVELIPLLLDCIQRQNSPILLERHRGSREPARPCLDIPLPP